MKRLVAWFVVVSFAMCTGAASATAMIFLLLKTSLGLSLVHRMNPAGDYEGYGGAMFIVFTAAYTLVGGFCIAFVLGGKIIRRRTRF